MTPQEEKEFNQKILSEYKLGQEYTGKAICARYGLKITTYQKRLRAALKSNEIKLAKNTKGL